MFLVRILLRFGLIAVWILHLLACMGLCVIKKRFHSVVRFSDSHNFLKSSGCLGCDTKRKLIPSTDDPLKGPKGEPQIASKRCKSEDFWTTSTRDLDNSAVYSRGSMSSISTTNQTFDGHGSATGSLSQEFINHGLLLWNQTRQQWIGSKRSENQSQQLREPKLSWNATYDSLLGSNKPFPRPVPLPEMVDFLVDIWEQEGMYD